MKLKLNKKMVFYLIFMFGFSLYLIYANNIILMFSDNVKIKKIDITNLSTNRSAYRAVDASTITQGLTEDFSCRGWAFCETNEDNSSKTIDVIMRGKKSTYSASAAISHRALQSYFPELSIKGNNNGFSIQFSTLNMKNDIYELLLYVKENENSKGIARVGKKYIKSNNGFHEYIPGKVSNISNINEVQNIKYSINVKEIDDEHVLFYGWAFIENNSTDFQNVFIQFSDSRGIIQTYDTISYSRPDVADYFNNELYYNSGFEVTVPKENLGDLRLSVIIENDDIYNKSNTDVSYNSSTNKLR